MKANESVFYTNIAILLFFAAVPTCIGYYTPSLARYSSDAATSASANFLPGVLMNHRTKRIPEYIVSDCMELTSRPGHYYYKKPKESYQQEGDTCGVYLIAEADQIVQVHFEYIDMPCETDNLVTFLDGWELNGFYFPSDKDYRKAPQDRFAVYCGKRRVKKVLESSLNAAIIHYKVPPAGKGFSFYFTTRKNPQPCNVVVSMPEFTYTLRNYGQRINCSMMGIFPSKITVSSLTVGTGYNANVEMETGTLRDCQQKGMSDYLQIGGGVELGDMSLVTDSVCGIDSRANSTVESIFCGVTAIRLVSSGMTDNQVTINMKQLSPDDPSLPGLLCPSDQK